jgi:acetyl esterase/lipase
MRSLLRFLPSLLALPLVCGCQAGFFRVVNGGRPAPTPTSVVYAPEFDLRLDVYRARDATGAAPVVVFFYGGSWSSGERAQYAFVGRALSARGLVAVIADYRKFPRSPFPAFEEDAARAARWTLDHATEFGGDRRRVFLAGHSAGAQIAALLATDRRYLATNAVAPGDFAGVIGIAGPYDFLPLKNPKLIDGFGPPSRWPDSQPIRFVRGGEPPFLLLRGDADRIVEPRNSTAMAAALRAHGDAVTERTYAGVGHFRILAAIRFTSLAPTLDDVVDFVRATPASTRR